MANTADISIVATDKPAGAEGLPRLDFIDGIRALAALFVVLCHSFFEPANGYYPQRFMNHLGLAYGHVAVDVFIVVSGFCLMLPVIKKGGELGPLGSFFARRGRRILPPYYAAILLSIAYIYFFAHDVTGTVWDNSIPLTWSTVWAHLLLVHDFRIFHGGGAINYPLWSIAVEFQIYLLMPLIVISLRRFGDAWTGTWAVAIGICLHFLWPRELDTALPWYIGLFALGCIGARLAGGLNVATAKRNRILALSLLGVVAAIMVIKGKDFFNSHDWAIDTLIGAATALFMSSTFADSHRRSSFATRALSWKPLVNVGVFSYSIYLIHAPMLHILDRCYTRLAHPGSITMFLLLLASSPIVAGAAYLFHLAFEKPFMTKRKVVVKVADPVSAEPALRVAKI